MHINLNEEKYWRYAARCRHCGFHNEWVVDKKQEDDPVPDALRAGMDWTRFHLVQRETRFPVFMEFCPGCENWAVYDLTAISARPKEANDEG